MSSQKTRHQKLNSYWVINSLGDNLSTQQRHPPQSLILAIGKSSKCKNAFISQNKDIAKQTLFFSYLQITLGKSTINIVHRQHDQTTQRYMRLH